MDSIRTIVDEVANEAGFLISDTNVFTSTDNTTKQIVSIANKTIGDMCERYAWLQLFKTGSITSVNAQADYDFPSDFSYYHYDTFYDQSNKWQIYGSLTPQEYAALKSLNIATLTRKNFYINKVSRQITIFPTPTVDGQIYVFEYLAARYVKPRTWVTGLSITSGNYIFFRNNYYTATTSGVTGATAPTHTSGTVSDGGVSWAFYSGEYKKFIVETDEPVINSRILSDGILARFLADKKDLSAKYAAMYEKNLEDEYGRYNNARIISCDSEAGSRYLYNSGTNRVVFGRL